MATQRRTRAIKPESRPVSTLARTYEPLFDTVFPVRAGGLLFTRDPLTDRTELVFGLGRLAHAATNNEKTLPAITVPRTDADDAFVKGLIDLENEPNKDLEWLALAAQSLHSLPLALENVSMLLGLSGRADAHRLVRFAARPPALRRAAVSAKVLRGHLRYLTGLANDEFAQFVQQVRGGEKYKPLSVRKLQDRLADGEAAHSADLARYQSDLGLALGARVEIHWPKRIKQRAVHIDWYGTDDLLGILQRLAAEGTVGTPANGSDTRSAPAKRRLTLALRSNDELEAVFGSLGREK